MRCGKYKMLYERKYQYISQKPKPLLSLCWHVPYIYSYLFTNLRIIKAILIMILKWKIMCSKYKMLYERKTKTPSISLYRHIPSYFMQQCKVKIGCRCQNTIFMIFINLLIFIFLCVCIVCSFAIGWRKKILGGVGGS